MADIERLIDAARTDADYEAVVQLLIEQGISQRAAREYVGAAYRERNDLPPTDSLEPDGSYDPDDDKRAGPSLESDLDAHHFLIPEVWGSYEDGEPLDLGKHGTFNPDGSEGIFGAKNAPPRDPQEDA